MNGKEIIKEIERYLSDKVYNYAVLIDGEWESGKTHFVKSDLTKEIEKRTKNENKKKINMFF